MPVRTVSPVDETDDIRPGGSYRERDGQQSQHSYTNDQHKYIWIPAGSFNNIDGQSPIMGSSGGLDAWIFPAGGAAEHLVYTSIWRPSKWINGIISFDFYYSENTGDTANMLITYEVSTWSVGDTLGAARDMLAETDVVATQASANKLYKKHWGYDTSPAPDDVTTSDELIGISTGRNANDLDDTYAGNLRFHGVLLTYIPNNRQ